MKLSHVLVGIAAIMAFTEFIGLRLFPLISHDALFLGIVWLSVGGVLSDQLERKS